MQSLTTRQAFDRLINEWGVFNEVGTNDSASCNYRKQGKEGFLSLGVWYDLVWKAGYEMVKEQRWELSG